MKQTFCCDEPVDLAEHKSIGGTEELNPGDPNRAGGSGGGGGCGGGGGLTQGGGDEKSNIVAGVHLHDFTGRYRPIQFLCFSTWVLYYQCCCINGLAVPHLYLSLSLSLYVFQWNFRGGG